MLKIKRLILILLILAAAFFTAFGFLRKHYVVPILMYHSVAPVIDPGNMIAVSAASFEKQMRFLKSHNYNVITLGKLAVKLKNREKIPDRTVVLTFDDGYKDNYTYAFPILKKYNLTADMFIIINEVGRKQNDRLSWDEIKEMQDSGLIYFGSHCLGPEPLVNIKSDEVLRNEIFGSKKILEERLGRSVSAFSYPEGLFNSYIRQLVIDAGYSLAVATNPGKNYPNNDMFALKRIKMSKRSANMFTFRVLVSGYYTFMKESKRKKHK